MSQFDVNGNKINEEVDNEPIVMNPGDIVVSFCNAKLLENKEFEIPMEANVYIVSADNEIGKTTTISGLETLVQVFNDTPDLITRGKSSAAIEGFIPKADGSGTIRIKFEIEAGKKKFVAYDGKKKITKVNEIRELIGSYVKLSVGDMLGLIRTADGRKKIIKDLIEPILTEEEKSKLDALKTKHKATFSLRTDVNKEVDKYDLMVKENTLTPVEKDFLSKEDLAAKTKKEYEDQHLQKCNELDKLTSDIENELTQTTMLLDSVNKDLEMIEQSKTEIDNKYLTIENNVKRIKELQQEIARLEKENSDENSLIITLEQQYKEKRNAKLTEQKTLIEKKADVEVRKENIATQEEKLKAEIADLVIRKSNGETFLSNVAKAKDKKVRFDEYSRSLKEKMKQAEDYTNDLEALTKQMKEIFTNSKLPKDLTIDEDTFYYKGFEFNENQVAESAMGVILAELLCNINTSFMVNAGNYGIYGKKRFSELVQMAKQYNKHIFVEAVQYGQTDVKIVGAVINDAPESEVKSLF